MTWEALKDGNNQKKRGTQRSYFVHLVRTDRKRRPSKPRLGYKMQTAMNQERAMRRCRGHGEISNEEVAKEVGTWAVSAALPQT